MNYINRFISMICYICVTLLLISCTAGNLNNTISPAAPLLSINDTSLIPVLSSASVPVYVHNNSDQQINGISFTVEYHSKTGISLLNLDQCSSIAAQSRCELSVVPPKIYKDHEQDSILIKATYKGAEISQILSFIKITEDKNGIFFAPAHAFIKDSYVTVYAYGGKMADYDVQEIAEFPLNIKLLKGHTFPLEIKATANKKLTLRALLGTADYIDEIDLAITPQTNGPVLMTGSNPVIKTNVGAITSSILVVNAGNQNTSSLTVSYPVGVIAATGTGACNLSLGLAAQASCTLYFTILQPGNGSGNIVIRDTGSSASTLSSINWYNANGGVLVQMSANPSSLAFTKNSSQSSVITITNNGPYTLNNLRESAVAYSSHAGVSFSENTCLASLGVNNSCSFTLTVTDTISETSNIILSILGSYNAGVTQQYSRILNLNFTSKNAIRSIAVGLSGTILTSDDMNTWLKESSGVSNSLWGVTANTSGRFVVVGTSGAILTSSDGNSWSAITPLLTANNLIGVTANASGKFVAVGVNGVILSSLDGQSWSTAVSGTTNTLYSIIANSGKFVAVGIKGTIIAQLNDTTWSTMTSGTTNDLFGITYNSINGKFVAVGTSGTILVSSSESSWSPASSGTNQNLNSITTNSSGKFVAVGASGTILVSADGSSWSAATSGTSNTLYAVTFNSNGKFIAVGASGTILTSSDGSSWSKPSSGVTQTLRGVTVNPPS